MPRWRAPACRPGPSVWPVAMVSARGMRNRRCALYGAQRLLVFNDARLVKRGVWPAPARLIAVHDAP